MTTFAYKLATYLSTGDVAVLQNDLFRGSSRVSRVSSVIPGSYGVKAVVIGSLRDSGAARNCT